MDDEVAGNEISERTAVSRRRALKAGVAVGVGAAVWSGVSITSLGGTPAYAAGCTFPVIVDLTGQTGCRNTDQGACNPKPIDPNYFGYHPLRSTLPTGFSITNNMLNGTCCDVVSPPLFHFPDNLTCAVIVEFSNSNDGKCTNPFYTRVFGPQDVGPISIALNCDPYTLNPTVFSPNSVYTIYAQCVGDGSDPTGC